MEVNTKEEKSKSHKEFEKLLSEDLGGRKFKEGHTDIIISGGKIGSWR